LPFSVTATQSPNPNPEKQTILFVGGHLSFPDVYLRLIASEFENFDVAIVPTLESAKAGLTANSYVAVALIFSARSVKAEPEYLFELFMLFPDLRPVFAYQTVADIKSLIDAIGGTDLMAGLSFLPLRTRIDSAINIFGLLVSGERHIGGDVMDYFLAEGRSPEETVKGPNWDQISSLTTREKDVLSHLSKGESNKVIAHNLQLSESTIKLHIHHIITKMGVSNRTEAAIAYFAATGNSKVEQASE
jgi:DNA-binding CsgD family transcriptional regulator